MSQNSKVCPIFHSWLWECKEGNVHESALTTSVCFPDTQYSSGKKGDRRKPILRGDGHRKFLSGELYCGQRKVKPRGCLAMLRTQSIAHLKMCSLVPAALVLRSRQVVAKRVELKWTPLQLLRLTHLFQPCEPAPKLAATVKARYTRLIFAGPHPATNCLSQLVARSLMGGDGKLCLGCFY